MSELYLNYKSSFSKEMEYIVKCTAYSNSTFQGQRMKWKIEKTIRLRWDLVQFSSVQLLSHVLPFAIPRTAACRTSLSITNSQSSPKLMSIESVMPSNHLILLLLPSIFPSIRVFSNESTLCISWPKYWSFSFSISPANEHPGLISFRIDWLDLLAI